MPGKLGLRERRQFYDALQRLLRIYQFRDRDRGCYGNVTSDECYALEAIESASAMRVNDLGRALGLHKSNASRLASSLEAKGFLARAKESGDTRAVQLRMTPRGRAAHATIRARVEDIHAGILSRFDTGTRARFVTLLEALAREAEARVRGGLTR